MKTKRTTFKKGDRVRWRTNRNNGRLRGYSPEVGKVISIRPSPSPHPPTVWVRTKSGRTGFHPDWLKLA